MKHAALLLLLLLTTATLSPAQNTSALRLIQLPLDLPSEGAWSLDESQFTSHAVLGPALLIPPDDLYEQHQSDRMTLVKERRKERDVRYQLLRHYWKLHRAQNNPEEDSTFQPEPNPDIVSIPGIRIQDKEQEEQLLAFHRQLDTAGQVLSITSSGRVEKIAAPDPAEFQKLHQVKFSLLPNLVAEPPPETVTYELIAPLKNPGIQHTRLTITNGVTRTTRELNIVLPPPSDDAALAQRYGENLYGMLSATGSGTSNRILDIWMRQIQHLFHGEMSPSPAPRRGQSTSLFSVMGGHAAIRETLQMENLGAELLGPAAERTIRVTDIPGVSVRAHDYEAMLNAAPGITLPLAQLCPPDRLFFYAPDASGLLPLLDNGSPLVHRMIGTRLNGGIQQHLLEKQCARLGMSLELVKKLLGSGVFGEVSLMLPDLFVQEGSDMTFVARMARPEPLLALLAATGIRPGESTLTPGPGSSLWTLRGDLLIGGTRRTEIEKVLSLLENAGKDSLGAEAEFRYMLTQCGPDAATRAFVYLSDPFLRRLTGPEVKIGQLRRLAARADLEGLSAGDLLHRFLLGTPAPDAASLLAAGFAPPLQILDPADLTFPGGVPTHPVYGSAANMTPLTALNTSLVTAQEQKAYETYRENYSRFWQQFFDPIAIALRETDPRHHEMEIFILPLIDSSIYQGLRQSLATRETAAAMNVPELAPKPLALFSLQLSETTWVGLLDDLFDGFGEMIGLDTSLWDNIGPSVHIAIDDAPGVIEFTGGLLGQTNSRMISTRDMMTAIPLISFFTRPVTVLVELRDSPSVLKDLQNMSTGKRKMPSFDNFLGWDIAQVVGQDRWIINLRIMETLTLRVGMEVQGDWLVFSNQPLTLRPIVQQTGTSEVRSAGITLHPEAVEITRLHFITQALERDRRMSMNSLSVLGTYANAGIRDAATSRAHSLAHFGFEVTSPVGDRVLQNPGGPRSSLFGTAWEVRIPDPKDVSPEALFPGVNDLRLFMQFEQDGLRTLLRWNTLPPPPLIAE